MGVQYSQTQDVDVKNYIAACGLTDTQGKRDIYNFVQGIKALGIWNNFICYPSRSIHNAGSGSTVYSLGGLGTYNATIVNSMTWSTSGLTSGPSTSYFYSTALSNYLQSLVNGTNKFCLMFGYTPNGSSSSSSVYWNRLSDGYPAVLFATNWYGQNQQGIGYNNGSGWVGGGWFWGGASDNTPNTPVFYETNYGGTYFQNGSIQGGGYADISSNINVVSTSIIQMGNSTAADIATFFTAFAPTAYTTSIYSLFKATLGRGLGLP